MSFSSLRQLDNIRPPKTDGIVAPNPYQNYELIKDSRHEKLNCWQIFVQRWRVISTSELYDSWERIIVDSSAIILILLILWGIFSFLKSLL